MICELRAVSDFEGRGLLARPERIHKLLDEQAVEPLSLEKSWHGLHFVLAGESWGGDGPLAFLLAGGEPVGDIDFGYGPARVFRADEVAQIANALTALTPDDIDQRFDVEQMAEEMVYPQIWDEPRPDLLDEYLSYFEELKQFVCQAAQQRQALVITLG
jgi:hypothetical protein